MNVNNHMNTVLSAPYKAGTNSYNVLHAEIGFNDLAPKTKLPYFSVTAMIYKCKKDGTLIFSKSGDKMFVGGGCCHAAIALHLPSYSELIKWHLVDSNGLPMHYVANSMYHLKNGDVDGFKSCCIFDESVDIMPELDSAEKWLTDRMPTLKADFYACLTKFGFNVDDLRKEI